MGIKRRDYMMRQVHFASENNNNSNGIPFEDTCPLPIAQIVDEIHWFMVHDKNDKLKWHKTKSTQCYDSFTLRNWAHKMHKLVPSNLLAHFGINECNGAQW